MEIWIWWQRWSEISFLRVDTINLVSARNGKVGGIYFLIVMLVYGATVLLGRDLFSHGYGFLPNTPHWPHGRKVHGGVQQDGTGAELVMVVGWHKVAHTVTVGGVGASPGPGIRKGTCCWGAVMRRGE